MRPRCRLVLLARDAGRLEANAADLRVRGAAEVRCIVFDALDIAATRPRSAAAAARQRLRRGVGGLGQPPRPGSVRGFCGQALQLRSQCPFGACDADVLAPRFERQGQGVIGVISSPAGDRGRASNYVYGAAKAPSRHWPRGCATGCTARRARVTLLPGFVDTPMTAGFTKGPLWATPERVAQDIDARWRAVSVMSIRRGSGAGSCCSCGCCRSGCSFQTLVGHC